MEPMPPRPAPPPACLLALLLLALLGATASAQPGPPSYDFSRPVEIGRSGTRPSIAVASSVSEGATWAYWDDGEAVVRRRLDRADPAGEPVEVVSPGRGVRSVAAATVDGEPAVAWVRRDLDTGRIRHVVLWKGEERVLLDELQAYEWDVAAAPDGPAFVLSRVVDRRSTLRLLRWDGSSLDLADSDLDLARASLAFAPDGAAHVVALEGFRDRNAVGFASAEWTAFHLRVPPAGAGGGAREGGAPTRTDLGPAVNAGLGSRTAVAWAGGGPVAMWSGPGGAPTAARPDGTATVLEPAGSVIGIFDGALWWQSGRALRRLPLAALDGPAPDGAGAAPTAADALPSPNTPEAVATTEADGVRTLAWYGPATGGGYALYATSDARPWSPRLTDRIAARFDLDPYAVWEGLTGRLLLALLAAALASAALTPLYWIASLGVARRTGAGAALATGIALASAAVILAAALVVLRADLPLEARWALVGWPWWIALALALGALAAWGLLRRTDQEPQMRVLAAAWVAGMIAFTLLTLQTLPAWSGTFGGIL